jgi:uncharacterized protein
MIAQNGKVLCFPLRYKFYTLALKKNRLKTTIDHLPQEKQNELNQIVIAIQKRLPAEMIVLFGSYSLDNWVDDRYKENGTTYEYKSDLDILVILDTEVLAIRHENSKRWRYKIRRDSGKEPPINVTFMGLII